MSGRTRDYREMADPPTPEAYADSVRFGVWEVPLNYSDMNSGWRSLREGKLPGPDFLKAVKATMLKQYVVRSEYRANRRAMLAAKVLKAAWELEHHGIKPFNGSGAKALRQRRVRGTKRSDRARRKVQAPQGDGSGHGTGAGSDA